MTDALVINKGNPHPMQEYCRYFMFKLVCSDGGLQLLKYARTSFKLPLFLKAYQKYKFVPYRNVDQRLKLRRAVHE